jgi:hypothetical protein
MTLRSRSCTRRCLLSPSNLTFLICSMRHFYMQGVASFVFPSYAAVPARSLAGGVIRDHPAPPSSLVCDHPRNTATNVPRRNSFGKNVGTTSSQSSQTCTQEIQSDLERTFTDQRRRQREILYATTCNLIAPKDQSVKKFSREILWNAVISCFITMCLPKWQLSPLFLTVLVTFLKRQTIMTRSHSW